MCKGQLTVIRHLAIIYAVLCSLTTVGCIDDGERITEAEPYVHPTDPGSGPFNCAQDAAYTKMEIDNFEFGAAAGTWFANNDICEDCQALTEQRTALVAQFNALDAPVIDTDTSTQTLSPAAQNLANQITSVETKLRICRQTCESSASPNFFDKPVPASPIAPQTRCDSNYALHVVTHGLIDWGANLGNSFGKSQDISQYDGISFWARRAPHSHGVVRVEVSDQFTEPGKLNAAGVETALCTHEYTEDESQKGCDRFGNFATIGTTWQYYTLPFNEMRQSGWGVSVPYLDTQTLYSITFLFSAGTWDVWIDDVSYYSVGNLR